jgi:4-cresol dehydrogenase (hydroxylating) flavoprotein subunit
LTVAALTAALQAWTRLLGEERVLCGSAVEPYSRSTTGLARSIPAVLLPCNDDEVEKLVKIAAVHGVPLYPISTGRNWGYGCSLPVVDGCIVVDLSRLTALEVDKDLGIATIGPGVTQQALWERLRDEGMRFMVPTTGAGPTTSVLGNALERGYGLTPFADHFGAVTSLTAILADGTRYTSALTAFGAARIDAAHKWGLGPYLDGLFSQGAFGIVTSMTLLLARRPRAACAFVFEVVREEQLEDVVEAVREILQRAPGVVSGINLLNRRRVLSMTVSHPGPSGSVLAETDLQRMGSLGLTPWLGLGGIYGEPGVVRATSRMIRRELRGKCRRLVFFSERLASFASTAAGLVPGRIGAALQTRVSKMGEALDILTGRPRDTALPLAYWRSGRRPAEGVPMNPARDGCGLLWYAPLVPMLKQQVREFVETVERTCPDFGIEPLITLTSVSQAAFDGTVPILFDPSSQTTAAHDCYSTLMEEGKRRGFMPYRLNVAAMADHSSRTGTAYWGTVKKLKTALDPDGIIAPGRYAAR